MTNLSPTAQAVLDAATEGFWRTSLNSEGNGAAAAIRALIPICTRERRILMTIADELEANEPNL